MKCFKRMNHSSIDLRMSQILRRGLVNTTIFMELWLSGKRLVLESQGSRFESAMNHC